MGDVLRGRTAAVRLLFSSISEREEKRPLDVRLTYSDMRDITSGNRMYLIGASAPAARGSVIGAICGSVFGVMIRLSGRREYPLAKP